MTADLEKLVKPLVWHDVDTYGGAVWDAIAAGVVYRIIHKSDGKYWLTDPCCETVVPTLEAAKSAAQADYAARIAAALDPDAVAAMVQEHDWQVKARAQHWLRRTVVSPEDADVEVICEKHGYGAVMDAASRLWARKPHGSGAFYIGGCIGFKSDEEAHAAIAAIRARGEA